LKSLDTIGAFRTLAFRSSNGRSPDPEVAQEWLRVIEQLATNPDTPLPANATGRRVKFERTVVGTQRDMPLAGEAVH
jgi:hypothetical protein